MSDKTLNIGGALRFRYGQPVVVHVTMKGQKSKMEGLVIRSKPLEVSVHGIRLACDLDGKVATEGFAGAFITEKEERKK